MIHSYLTEKKLKSVTPEEVSGRLIWILLQLRSITWPRLLQIWAISGSSYHVLRFTLDIIQEELNCCRTPELSLAGLQGLCCTLRCKAEQHPLQALSRCMHLQASKLQERGAILVDCRVGWDYETQHIEGAVSVPLYRGVAGKTAWDTVKRAVMAVGFAMRATGAPSVLSRLCNRNLEKPIAI